MHSSTPTAFNNNLLRRFPKVQNKPMTSRRAEIIGTDASYAINFRRECLANFAECDICE